MRHYRKLLLQMRGSMPRARMTQADKEFREAVIEAFELLFFPPVFEPAPAEEKQHEILEQEEEEEEVATSSREVAPSTAAALASKLRAAKQEAQVEDNGPDGEQ